jgi:hypothetical protein
VAERFHRRIETLCYQNQLFIFIGLAALSMLNERFLPTVLVEEKTADTVGQPPGAEICVSNMPALKAKKLGKLPQGKYF